MMSAFIFSRPKRLVSRLRHPLANWSEVTPVDLSDRLVVAAQGLLDFGGYSKESFEISVTSFTSPGETLVISLKRTRTGVVHPGTSAEGRP